MAVRLIVDADVQGQRQIDRLNQSIRNIDTNTGTFSRRLGRLQGLIIAAFSVAAVSRFATALADATDALTGVRNQLTAAGIATEDLVEAQAQVLDLANATRSSYEATGALFARVLRSSRELGVSQEEALQITQAFQQSLQLSGASTQEAAAASLQFGQALASGRLQGDELRSILENNSFFAQALAMELGVGVGELRQLGAEGALTSELLAEVALRLAPMMNESFSQLEPTFGQAFTVFNNGLQQGLAGVGAFLNETLGINEALISAGNIFSGVFGPDAPVFDWDAFIDELETRIENIDWAEVLVALGGVLTDIVAGVFAVGGDLAGLVATFFIDAVKDIGAAIYNSVIDAFTGFSFSSLFSSDDGFEAEAIEDLNNFAGGANQGGRIVGPGTGTSDSILARLSNGEFVINAQATRQYLPLLEAINSGQIQAFQTGGLVGRASAAGLQISVAGLDEATLARLSRSLDRLEIAIMEENDTLAEFQRGRIRDLTGSGDDDGSVLDDALMRAQTSFASALAVGFSSGDFSNVIDSVLNTFTSSIIGSFSESIASAVFESIDFGSLFSGGGGDTIGQLLSAGSSFFGGFFQEGGYVPGNPNQAVPIVAHGGELVLNREQQEELAAPGVTVNVNVQGDVSRQTRQEIMAMLPEIADTTQAIFTERRILSG